VKQSQVYNKLTHVLLVAGLFTACENGQVLNMRNSSSAQQGANDSDDSTDSADADDSDKAKDELFNLELHKAQVAKGLTASARRRAPTKACPTPAAPELPKVSPESPGMTVGQTIDVLVFVCSKSNDQFKALWAFGQSVTPEQLANLSSFEPGLGTQLLRLQSITKLVNLDVILGLKGLFCPSSAGSQPAMPGAATSTSTSTATSTATSSSTGTATSTSTSTNTGKVTVSGKDSANLP